MSEIIEIDFKNKAKQPSFSIKKPVEYRPYCSHPQVEIDNHERILSCANCGKVLDAYEYVHNLAIKETRLFDNLRQLKENVEDLTMARDTLKKQVSRLKLEHKKMLQAQKCPITKPSVARNGNHQASLLQIKNILADKSS
ncbi:MAG: hypothetical protein PHR16_11925 [Methylovulum sp.]|nr:hypothetical protein [Methylovulum sp.]